MVSCILNFDLLKIETDDYLKKQDADDGAGAPHEESGYDLG
jgi:hypothetical protein